MSFARLSLSERRRRERGAAAVEFALVLPILIMLIFGIIDFGRMLNARITITEAAREGARAAALVDAGAGADRAALAAGDLSGDLDAPVVAGCDADGTENASVTLTYHFHFLTPLGIFFGDTTSDVDLHATGIMPCLT